MYSQNYPPPMQRQTNSKAIAALILAILGLIGVLPLIGSVLGIILGNGARTEIRASYGAQEGDGLAQAGVIIGWVGIILGVIAILSVCVLFVFLGGLAAFLGGTSSP